MPQHDNLNTELRVFEQSYDTSREDQALSSRGQFLRDYPLGRLKKLTVDDYVIGRGTASFCAHVEAKTKAWANIYRATSFKFGIYFGRTKSEPARQYRFSSKFGENKNQAFGAVKAALLDLVKAGQTKDFSGIDNNPLSQMFKAKILSLYFPDLYLNVCSAEHLEYLASDLRISEQPFVSQYQHLLVQKKQHNLIAKNWSNPKFMSFLYSRYIRRDLSLITAAAIKKPRKKARRSINFEDVATNRGTIGRTSEKFALEWEKNRLIGLGYPELVRHIEDRRDFPSFGYDFLSYNAPDNKRYIEVKSVGKNKNGGGFRFYLSENERFVSNSKEHGEEYYFYLVFYGNDKKPCDLVTRRARELYSSSDLSPCAYMVSFDIG